MKKPLLLVTALVSVVIAAAAGYYYWDTLVLGVLAALLWVKKLATLKGLLLLLKKLPFLLLLGLKRLVVKITSRFLLFTAHLRFKPLRKMLRYFRWRAYKVKNRLKYHWEELSGMEKILATVTAIPLVIILTSVIVIFFLPKTLVALFANKIKANSSAAVLNQAAQLGVKKKISQVDQQIKKTIEQRVSRKTQLDDEHQQAKKNPH